MAEGGVNLDGPGTDFSADRRSLLVQGLTPEISTELLELYFENSRYGGGDIESISMDTEDAVTIIFKKPEGKNFLPLLLKYVYFELHISHDKSCHGCALAPR